MRTVAIVGVGLIGASFGLALRKAGFNGSILGVSSAPAIEAGVAAGAISGAATLQQAAEAADLIYLAQPVDRIITIIGQLGSIARKGTLVTDAGSTKAAIVQAARRHFQQARFVGGHPMAGKETRGAQSAEADLFRHRPYILTPASGDAVPESFRELLQATGADLMEMTPEEHDATVALTSHLPQLISTSLARCLARPDKLRLQEVFGSGLLDMTRLALSPIDLWKSILSTNKANVGHALEVYIESLLEIQHSLENDDLASAFSEASDFAASLRKTDHRTTGED